MCRYMYLHARLAIAVSPLSAFPLAAFEVIVCKTSLISGQVSHEQPADHPAGRAVRGSSAADTAVRILHEIKEILY